MGMRALAIVGVFTLVLGAACGAPQSSQSAPREGESVTANSGGASADTKAAAAPAQRAAAPGAPAAPAAADASQQNLPRLDRMIIRTVTMTISVANVQESFRQVERIALEQGGMIAGSQVRQEGERTTANVTVRVPADPATYQATLERLRAVADKVVEEQAQAQDITEEFVDLESRLRNLRASEDSLLALLAKAQRVEDLLQIQRELTNVRGQIEQIQGRKQALERRADMATINLQIREAGSFSRSGWNPGQTVTEALQSLGRAFQALATLAIWLLVWSPLWGGLLVALWLLRRVVRMPRLDLDRRRTPAASPPTP